MVTRNDLLVILRIGVHVAKLDGDFSVEEKHLLLRLLRTLRLTPAERDSLYAESATLSGLIDRLSSQEARELMLKMVCTVAQCDHRVEDVEEAFVEKLHEAAHVNLPLPPKDAWHLCALEIRSAFQVQARLSPQH